MKVCLIKNSDCIFADNCTVCTKYHDCESKQGSHRYCFICKYKSYGKCIKEIGENEDRPRIFVLKRSNGFIGIYVNGYKQENLISNSNQSIAASYLFDMVKSAASELGESFEIIFTEEEDKFISGLPSLQEYLTSNGID